MMKYIFDYIMLLPILWICIVPYKIITNEKIQLNFKKIILFLIITFCSLLVRYTNTPLLTLITNIIFIFIILKESYNINYNKALYYCIVITIISLFADAIISIVLSNAYLLNLKFFVKNYIFRQLLSIPVCLIIILISYIPFLKKVVNNFYNKYIFQIEFTKTKLLFLVIIVSAILTFFCLNAYTEVDKIGHLFVIIGTIAFSFLFVVTLYLLYKEYQIKIMNNNIIEENKYIKKIAKQDEEFKHNIINNLLGIKTVANKKTNLLIDDLINDYRKEYKNITNINDLPDGILSIIYRKAYEENIDNLNLIVDNNIKEELYELLTPKKYNKLCTAIGIIFDNAIDAVKNINEKIIEINLKEDNNNIYIILKNSFSNIVDLEEIGTKNFTTKTSGHGIGINYMKKIKEIYVKNEIINNMFMSKLTIKKSKKYRN